MQVESSKSECLLCSQISHLLLLSFSHTLLLICLAHWGRIFSEVAFEFLSIWDFTNVSGHIFTVTRVIFEKEIVKSQMGKKKIKCDFRKQLASMCLAFQALLFFMEFHRAMRVNCGNGALLFKI